MIATFFLWRIDPKQGEAFRSCWSEVTEALKQHGSGGSTLFRKDDDHYCALARWPDRTTRDAAFAAEAGSDASKRLRSLVSVTIEQIDLDELDNKWRD